MTYGKLFNDDNQVSEGACNQTARRARRAQKLTWNNIARIHRILVLNKAEAVHELDLGDFSGAMGRKVAFNVGLGDFSLGRACQHGTVSSIDFVFQRERDPPSLSRGKSRVRHGEREGGPEIPSSPGLRPVLFHWKFLLTVAGKVAQIEPGRRHLRHDCDLVRSFGLRPGPPAVKVRAR
jgi:hypothetical protein